MIKDRLENAELYYGISNNLKLGFEWLKNNDLTNIDSKKYIINDKIYANVQEYSTKNDALYEAHREYIDIQYVVKGAEKVGVCNKSFCKTVESYNPEKDIEFMENTLNDEWQTLNKGEFLVLFPTDAHKPSINIENSSQNVKKVVVKVAIN